MTALSRHFQGIGASPGIAIGRVFLLDRRKLRVRRYHIQPDQADGEVKRLEEAIQASVTQLESIRNQFVDDGRDHQAILEGHEMMLRDPALLDEAAELIRQDLLNAEWAVRRVIARIRNMFVRVANSYFRERLGDFDFVGERILRNLAGQLVDITDVTGLTSNTIVVAHDLSPVDSALLSRHHIIGFVTEVGGKTSHTSIVARSLEVPAVVGAPGILDAAGSGDTIVIDGSTGSAILRPTAEELETRRNALEVWRRNTVHLLDNSALPAQTQDGVAIHVAGNIELPHEVSNVVARGGQGIGLYRTEFLFLGREEIPDEEEHYRSYCRIFEEVGPHPVIIRTLDLGGEKIFGPICTESEPNPALGLRAIRYCLRHPHLFKAQLAGLLRAATQGDLRIMLPMVSDLGEVLETKRLLDDVRHELTSQGKMHRSNVPIGVMVEVPSAALAARTLAEHCDFFAVGTNDLMQYVLAIDRTNELVDYLYNPVHPTFLRLLSEIATAAKSAGIPVSVCGEMAGETDYTAVLLGLGFRELSMNAGSIPRVKDNIRHLHLDACQTLAQKLLASQTAHEANSLMQQFRQFTE